jgi:hypothetical protein
MAARASAVTISRTAEILGEDEEFLSCGSLSGWNIRAC